MNRLLQGDVGSGKTVVALMSMLLAIDNGFRPAHGADGDPRQPACRDDQQDARRTDVPVALLTGSTGHGPRGGRSTKACGTAASRS